MGIGLKHLGYIARPIGAIATYLVVSDAIKSANHHGHVESQNAISDHLTDVFISHQSSPNASYLREDIKKSARNFLLSSSILDSAITAWHYATAYAGQLISSGLAIGLSLAALFTKTGNSSATTIPGKMFKGFMPKVIGIASAGVLVATAAKMFFMDGLGWFKGKQLH